MRGNNGNLSTSHHSADDKIYNRKRSERAREVSVTNVLDLFLKRTETVMKRVCLAFRDAPVTFQRSTIDRIGANLVRARWEKKKKEKKKKDIEIAS